MRTPRSDPLAPELPSTATVPLAGPVIRGGRLAALAITVLSTSCAPSGDSTGVRSFLEAVQSPFDLGDRTLLGVPAQPLAHLVVAALLVAALAWWWRPMVAGVLAGGLIVAKEAVDLTIVALYQPVTWTYASDSVWDVALSVVGGGVGLWVALRVRRRRSTVSPREESSTGARHAPEGSEPGRGDGNPPSDPGPG